MGRFDSTRKIVLTGLMMCLVMVATFIIRIPAPFTHGYIHLGDTAVFLSVLVLGKKRGALASGVGSVMADIIGGFAAYAPWTLVIKALMAVVMGLFIDMYTKAGKPKAKIAGTPVIVMVGMVMAGLVMLAGYAAADGIFAGNILAGILGVPFNIIQFAAGMGLATVLAVSLYKTPVKKYFAYRLDD